MFVYTAVADLAKGSRAAAMIRTQFEAANIALLAPETIAEIVEACVEDGDEAWAKLHEGGW